MVPIWYILRSANTSPAQTSMHWRPHSKMEVREMKHWYNKISVLSGRNAQECHVDLHKTWGECRHSKMEELNC
jgi:hypothetical protein